MSILSRIYRLFSGRVVSSPPSSPLDEVVSAWSGGTQSSSGITVGTENALNCSAYFNGVTLLSEALGVMPLFVYRRLGNGGKEIAPEHPVYTLLHDRPNFESTPSRFRRYMQSCKLLWGNAYAEVQRDRRGRPIALWPIHPSRVLVYRGGDDRLSYKVYGNPPVEIPADDVLHIRGFSTDGVCGRSVISLAREALGLGLASEQFASRFFKNGAISSVVLKHPAQLSEQAQQRLRKTWRDTYGGENQLGVAVAEEGMDVQQLSIPNEDSQLLQTRNFQTIEIARFLNIPPHKLKNLDRATFSNIEHQSIEYVTDSILPHCVEFEEECEHKLLTDIERYEYYVEFAIEGLLRGDSQSRGAFYQSMWSMGAFSINDIRKRENENPIGPAGDQHFVQLNLTTAERILQGQPQQMTTTGKASNDLVVTIDKPTSISLMPILVDIFERLIRKENNATSRAATKYRNDRKGFDVWIDKFLGEHICTVVTSLNPVKEAASFDDIKTEMLDRFAMNYISDCRASMAGVYGGESADEWSAQRATDLPRKYAAIINSIINGESYPCS